MLGGFSIRSGIQQTTPLCGSMVFYDRFIILLSGVHFACVLISLVCNSGLLMTKVVEESRGIMK
jgi:hypothetical protein